MIEALNLTRRFGLQTAVSDVSFTVARGTIAAFLGPNGAGKTTTLRLITGALTPDGGSARIDGHDVICNPLAARARFGYLPEAAAGFDDLTVRDVLMFVAESRGLWGTDRTAEITRISDLLGLSPALDRIMQQLSKGWRQRAWLAQALIGDPPALILDEPTDGLDPTQRSMMHRVIGCMAPRKAILLSTHDLDTAESLATRVIVIVEGRIAADASIQELADSAGRLGPAFERIANDVRVGHG